MIIKIHASVDDGGNDNGVSELLGHGHDVRGEVGFTVEFADGKPREKMMSCILARLIERMELPLATAHRRSLVLAEISHLLLEEETNEDQYVDSAMKAFVSSASRLIEAWKNHRERLIRKQ